MANLKFNTKYVQMIVGRLMRAGASSLVFLAMATAAWAQTDLARDINETTFKLRTTVKTMYINSYSGEMTVTQFKPDGNGPFPIAVLLHGRSGTDRSQPARMRFTNVAHYLVRRGFAVWVPTRLGYGESGINPDPEDTGDCQRKVYAPGYEAAATSTLDVISYAKAQTFVDPNRILIIGVSFGGMTSIALAAKNPVGVIATINFAGGGGGNPDLKAADPCRPDLLQDLFADYGKTARVPTLWVYSENDKYWGASHPKKWYAAFEKNGGKGEFKAMPPFESNGHTLFSKGLPIWRPVVDDFLARQGFSIPKSADAPAPSQFAALDQVDKVPLVSMEGREKYQRFLQLDIPRAYAIGPHGEFAYYSSLDAMSRVIDMCKEKAKTECRLYAVDDEVVWKQ